MAEKRIGKIRAIKLDIEGAELLALHGAQELLCGSNKPDLIALELVQAHATAFGISTSSIIRFLADRDYELNQLIEQPDRRNQVRTMDVNHKPPDGTLIALADCAQKARTLD